MSSSLSPKYYIKLLIVFFPFFLFGGNQNKSLVGSVAPNWILKSNSGKMEFLNNYSAIDGKNIRDKGGKKEKHVVVLSFFATWCRPCLKEIKELQNLQEKYSSDPVAFFLIDLTDYYRKKDSRIYKDSPKTLSFLKDKGLDKITVLFDDRGILAKDYNANDVLPRLFVIDKNQIIRLDASNICSSCIQDELSEVIDLYL